MCIRFLVACCLLSPAAVVSAQVSPGGACDGDCQHSHPPTGSAFGGDNPDPWSSRMYGDVYGARAQAGYGAPQQSQPMQNQAMGMPPYDQSRSSQPVHRRHSHSGSCRHGGGHGSWPGAQNGGRYGYQYSESGRNPGVPPLGFAAPGNPLQSPSDRQQIEQPSLPPAFPQASPQVYRQQRQPTPANRSSYWNI
ncbi:hypothetical protein [Rubripirellula reticaptiva]|uniref:Translation initiation factor IF-2 n=1 Tax=Rubripirellula reticaptiva TaxID=2528013 RepID=A0A5C6F5W7_9BACT|nr:hypothetical protein [Rubripirellula reticaptiva]TWU55827.1 hypothetical protein Poly59_21300 [Rubripirellula reticaptiva]